MELEIYDNEEQLLIDFKKIHTAFNNEDIAEDPFKSFPDLLKSLLKIERSIQSLGLFSPNENYEEVNIELLPLVNLPYLIGLSNNKDPSLKRRQQIKKSEQYYIIFINLLKHYKIIPDKVQKVFDEYTKDKNYKIERMDKIGLYKKEKELKDEVGKFKQNERDVMRINTQINSIKTMNSLLFIPQELQILDFKDKLETDDDFRQTYEKEKAKKPEKLKFFKIEKDKQEPLQINSKDLQPAPNQKRNIKQEVKDKLWQHSYTQPKMTMEEFDNLEYTLMMDKQAKNAEREEMMRQEFDKLGIKNPDDSDEELVSEMQTYKDREWDDWKDMNEKGGGNRMGK